MTNEINEAVRILERKIKMLKAVENRSAEQEKELEIFKEVLGCLQK